MGLIANTSQRGKGVGKERGSHEGENLRDRVRGCKSLTLVPLVVSLVNSSNIIKLNSEPEKCCPTKRTIGSLSSYSKLNDITEAHKNDFSYPIYPLTIPTIPIINTNITSTGRTYVI